MKYFSIPADFKLETIDKYFELNNKYNHSKIIETYGQATIDYTLNCGRMIEVLPKVDFKSLEEYVKYSKEKGIEFNYTLNPSCYGNLEFSVEGIKELMNLLKKLNSIGVAALTITTPSLIELVKNSGFDFKIKTSAISEISHPSKALFYKDLGVDRIVTDADITREFDTLRNICEAFGEGVEIIINNVCYKNCVYKMFHYNHDAHCTPENTSQVVKDFYINRCGLQKTRSVKDLIRGNWIRPEDLKYYKDVGINHFKIQGRQSILRGDIIKALEAYFEEDFDGNLYALITLFAPHPYFKPCIDNKSLDGYLKPFFENPGFCDDMCSKCGYCESYAKKSMDLEALDKLKNQSIHVFKNGDKYTELINKCKI